VRRAPRFSSFLWALFKVGLTAYGGPAIVAQLRQELVLRRQWLAEEEFAESLAFAQLVPGPVVSGTAAHAAQRLYGPWAVFPAVLAYAAPAFFLMLALSVAYFRWGSIPAVHQAFVGLGPVIVAIVASSTLSLAQPALRDLRGLGMALVLLPLLAARVNAVLVVLLGALAGTVVFPNAQNASGQELPPPGSRRRGLVAGGIVAGILALATGVLALTHAPLARLSLAVSKIALLAFGGGYTAVALMYHAFVESHPPLLPAKVFVDGLALGQLTPGPVVITSTFVGYAVAGVAGAALATAYTFLPPGVLIAVLAPHFARLRGSHLFQRAVRGALAAFVALLLHVLALVGRSTLTAAWAGPAALLALALLRLRVPILLLIVGAVLSSLLLAA
jgi:chromate transporter